jgi:phosphatidylethanolamine-binding protein (PEBP) family uncharacterized protein
MVFRATKPRDSQRTTESIKMNVGTTASVKSMVQEAMETAAQTKSEAAKGDQQAVRKLAQAQTANPAQSVQQPPENTKRGLDAKA